MKLFLPVALTLTTALITYWYADYTQKYQSLFLTSALNAICFIAVTMFAYYQEGPTSLLKLNAVFTEWYIWPYLILNVAYGCFWYYLTISHGAAYTGIYESSYILLLVIMNLVFKGEKLDLKFFLGALLVCIGIAIIEYE